MIEIVMVIALALAILGLGALAYWMKHRIDALKNALGAQENTIRAQGEVIKNVQEVHSLMRTVLNILDAPAMVKRWEDYQALIEHEREQLVRVQQQEGNDAHATMVGLVDVVSSLILYTPSSQRRDAIDATSFPPYLKEHLHRIAAAAPDRSTLTVTFPHGEDRSLSVASALSPAQPQGLPTMPSPSPPADQEQGTSP